MDTAKFCQHCGVPVSKDAGESPSAAQPGTDTAVASELVSGPSSGIAPTPGQSAQVAKRTMMMGAVSADQVLAAAKEAQAKNEVTTGPGGTARQAAAPREVPPGDDGDRSKEESQKQRATAPTVRASLEDVHAARASREESADRASSFLPSNPGVWEGHSERPPSGQGGGDSWGDEDGFSSRVSLSVAGVPSKRSGWVILLGVALGCFGTGALAMRFLFPVESGGGEVPGAVDESSGLEVAVGVPTEPGKEIIGGDGPGEILSGGATVKGRVAAGSAAGSDVVGSDVVGDSRSDRNGATAPGQQRRGTATGSGDPLPSMEVPDDRDIAMEMYGAQVRSVIRRYYAPRARSCFERVLRNAPSVHGTVVVGFVIGNDGQVSSSTVARNTTGHELLGRCLAGQVNTWRLPAPPDGPLELEMPFSN